MIKRKFIKNLGLAALASAISFSTAIHAQAPKKVTIALAGDGLHVSTIHIANLGGFFKEEGIELDLVDVNSGPRQVAAMMGGSADFAILGFIHTIKAYNEGGEILAVASLFDVLDTHIFLTNDALKKSGITPDMPIDEKVKRMQGLRIGISSPGSTTDTVVRTLFKARGMDPDKVVQLQPLGGSSNMLAAVEKNLTDGFAWSAPQPEIAELKGLGKIVINPLKGEVPEMKDVPYQSLATSRQVYEKKPEETLRTLRAVQGYEVFPGETGPGQGPGAHALPCH
ncbi:ABC transporter substrate-binding protein [Polaromonas sp. P1(28)-13]|nr:ABC transporter substrate-binding protein [Polaromonas sp. P1(28)-13]